MSFSRPTLTELDGRVRADIEATMDAVPIVRRGSVLAGLARALAGGLHSVHGHAQWIFRQVFADTADAENLERHAALYDIARADPAKATGAVDVTGADGVTIPAGARLGHATGEELIVTAAVVIAGGVAEVSVEAAREGAAGNLSAGDAVAFLSPVLGADDGATIAAPGLSGGADAEGDERLLERYLLRVRQPPHGGAEHDYVFWTLATPGVTRVWVSANEVGVGTVTVRFAVDDASHGPAPNSGEIDAVQTYIEERRPVTAEVFVVAPILVPLDVELTLTPDNGEVREAVEANLADLIRREAAPGATILLSHIREAISLAIGETDHVLVSPAANVDHDTGEMAVLGDVTFS